jgi:N-acetylneuraminic acid mutarotase
VRAYDPVAMSWRDVANFPGPLNHPNVGSANGKLYVLGFYGTNMTDANPQVFAYDPAEGEWTEVAPLPTNTERAGACVATIGDMIYVFGGAANGMSVARAAVYDTVGDSWQTLPDMPVAREHCVAGAVGGKIYIAGGRTNTITGIVSTTLEFDPASPGYVEMAPMITPRGGLAGAVLGGLLFTFGGEGSPDDPNGVFPDIEAYDPAANRWEAYDPMLIPRHGMGAAELGGRIYIPGGANRQGGASVNDVSVFYFE